MPPPMRHHGPPRKAKDAKKTMLRLLSYLKKYIPNLLVVMLCIVAAAVAQTVSSTALGNLVDDFILPMVGSGSADFEPGQLLPGGYDCQLLPELFDGSCYPGCPEDHP